ncbi:MAG: molybdenum cofactor guanylyltransferase MobA [Sulfurovum sp.]|nr:molybdenum cofactor guanylyltransferase MobA [Sulfurovum sp.]
MTQHTKPPYICQHAVIFAGGKSTRMGKDKALLPFADETSLSQYQYKKLKQIFAHVYIIAKKHKFNFDCEFIEDKYPESSPLVGLLSLFETLDAEEVFVLSVDTPFIDKSIIHQLLTPHPKATLIIAQSPSGIQPLCGLYKKAILPLLQTQYQQQNHKLQDLLQQTNTQYITFLDNHPFTNLNYPKEYEEALKLV